MRQIVDQEAPIHIEQVYDRLKQIYGHGRTGRRIKEYVNRTVKRAVRRRLIMRKGLFLWKPRQTNDSVRPRGPGDVARPPEHICLEEWQEAVHEILQQLGATPREQVIRHAAAALLGYNRLSSEVRRFAEDAVDHLVQQGRVTQHEGILHLTSGP
ncbi:MAG: DUF3320 domain-containing protein [Firmicutes bacterium]|nr:DUF3320 domain-containing protein [Bacillota bacterium]